MILKTTYNYFFSDAPFKYYAIENPNEPDIEAIYYAGEALDLTNPESLDIAINFLNECKQSDIEICDSCKSPIVETLFGSAFIMNIDKIHETMNETTDKVIELLTATKYELLKENEPYKEYTDKIRKADAEKLSKNGGKMLQGVRSLRSSHLQTR